MFVEATDGCKYFWDKTAHSETVKNMIANVRKDDGLCTCYSVKRGISGANLIDYIITGYHDFALIKSFEVKDLMEQSDHCPIVSSMDEDCNDTYIVMIQYFIRS